MKMIKIFSLLLFMGLFFTACSDDDPAPNPDPNTQVDPDPDTDPEPDPDIDSGYLTAFGVDGPQGRVIYFDISENVPDNLDISNALEVGLNVRPFGIGDNPFSWNSNSQTITKYEVDRTDLSITVEGIVSLASLGFNSTFLTPAVISDSTAYFFDLAEGVAIEWDYENMVINEVINTETWLDYISGDEFAVTIPRVIGDKIFMSIREYPLRACCDIGNEAGIDATVAVFDTVSKTLEYVSDDRLMAAFNQIRVDADGSIYIVPPRENAFIEPYYDYSGTASPHLVLKMNQDGTFDSNFEFDLASVIPTLEKIEIVPTVLDGKAIVQYYDSRDVSLDTVAFDDRYSVPRSVGTRSVSVDLTTGEGLEFTALADYDFTDFLPETRGELYVVAYSQEVNPFDVSHILRINSFDSYTELSAYRNIAAQFVIKLWGD